MKKHFIYILLAFAFYKPVNAQVYTAGTIYPYYYDITPDSILNFRLAGSHVDNESYYMDVNGDFISDLRLNAYALGGPWVAWGYIRAIALNSSVFFRKGRLDATGNNVALPLNLNDSINAKTAIWDTARMMITYHDQSPSGIFKILDWCVPNDLYIGVKYQNLNDTIYGWIRVNCDYGSTSNYYYQCQVKDYSFQSIYAGIEEYTNKKIKVFPNPVSNILKIENKQNNFQNSQLEIINSLGQTVLKTEFKNQIDVSELASGFYTLLLKDNTGSVITKKIIKE